MLFFLTLILACQLIGEVIVIATGLPVPGPVIGMVLLFLGMLVNGGLPEGLAKVADALLNHLSLLFVPAGVGVMLHVGLIGRDLVPITAALVASTLVTVAVTAAMMAWLGKGSGEGKDLGGPDA
jgi:putative effector of murein hydrolase LrgA (UPF0299 family)